jgi:hypothetical protein
MAETLRSADMLVKSVLSDPAKRAALATDPDAVLQAAAAQAKDLVPAYVNDKWIYRVVVGALSLAVLVVLGAYIYLAGAPKDPPEALVAIGSGALGALTGLLAPSPGQKS